MSLLEQIRADIKDIISNEDEFGVSITLVSSTVTKTVVGLHTKHHLGIDTDGNMVNTKNAHIAISESNLTGYPVRNAKGEVSMRGHLVLCKDSTGVEKTYKIEQTFPDETVGLIVIILGDYATS